MSTLDPSIKNLLFILLFLSVAFTLFIIVLVRTYKRRQTEFIIDSKLKESKLTLVKLENEIETLKAINLEKERISADIHDDMGSNVASIHLISKIIQTNELASSENIEYLKQLQAQSQELSQKMKDIVWATKSENDNLENLIFYIQRYVIKQLEPLGVISHIERPSFLPFIELNGEIRKDLLMVVKESINNIIKHSGAKSVQITFSLDDSKLLLIIKDDGNGLNDTIDNGNGINQMKKRIEKYNGLIDFRNENGLRISIEIDVYKGKNSSLN